MVKASSRWGDQIGNFCEPGVSVKGMSCNLISFPSHIVVVVTYPPPLSSFSIPTGVE